MGYHLDKIKKGELGKSSKIMEEVLELIDSEKQGVKIMALVELSDLIGAISSYLELNYPDISLSDLLKMSEVTKRAFKSGARK